MHYSFASMTAQMTALYPGFLAAALAGGVPPMLAALPLAYFSNSERRDDALRHRLRAGIFRRGICAARRMVEDRLPDLGGEPGDLDGGRVPLWWKVVGIW